jgi:hypothetical protein
MTSASSLQTRDRWRFGARPPDFFEIPGDITDSGIDLREAERQGVRHVEGISSANPSTSSG